MSKTPEQELTEEVIRALQELWDSTYTVHRHVIAVKNRHSYAPSELRLTYQESMGLHAAFTKISALINRLLLGEEQLAPLSNTTNGKSLGTPVLDETWDGLRELLDNIPEAYKGQTVTVPADITYSKSRKKVPNYFRNMSKRDHNEKP